MVKKITEMKLLRQGNKNEHKPILKRAATLSKKKVTFVEKNESPKEHKRLHSPPKERPDGDLETAPVKKEEERKSDENLVREPESENKRKNERDEKKGSHVPPTPLTSRAGNQKVQTKDPAKSPSQPSKMKVACSETLVTEHVGKLKTSETALSTQKGKKEGKSMGLTMPGRKEVEVKTVLTEGTEDKEALEMPKPKQKKPATTSAVYAKMKELHKKRKAFLNLGGSVKDFNKPGNKLKK